MFGGMEEVGMSEVVCVAGGVSEVGMEEVGTQEVGMQEAGTLEVGLCLSAWCFVLLGSSLVF